MLVFLTPSIKGTPLSDLASFESFESFSSMAVFIYKYKYRCISPGSTEDAWTNLHQIWRKFIDVGDIFICDNFWQSVD